MGIDMTPNPDNPNIEENHNRHSFLGGALDNIEPQDHIEYDRKDGWARWMFDTNTDTFVMLHLPFYFAKAPQCIKTELIEHCRKIAMGVLPDTFPLPEHVEAWRDSPSTKAIISAIKTGQASLEAWE